MTTNTTTNPKTDTDATERAILEALDDLWSARHTVDGWTEALDDAAIDALLPFGEGPATHAIRRHRSDTPIHRRAPDIDAMVALARRAARGNLAWSGEVAGGWKPPVDTPEEIARSKRIEEWARDLDDFTVNWLTERAVGMGICTRWMTQRVRLRESPLGRAMLVEAARRSDPSTLPVSLREDIDTRAPSVKARSA
jgi:hypothetical protein